MLDLGEDYRAMRRRHPDDSFVKVFTFNSARKSMSTVIPLESGGYRVYTKGASEIILGKCSIGKTSIMTFFIRYGRNTYSLHLIQASVRSSWAKVAAWTSSRSRCNRGR